MKNDIEYLKDTFKIGYEAYEISRDESRLTWELYHNRHYTAEQLGILKVRGQPAETFNIIKIFARLLLGYYSTIVTTVSAEASQQEDNLIAEVVSDVMQHVLRDSNFKSEGEKIKLSGLLSGLLCAYTYVEPTGDKDKFGRPKHAIKVEHVPDYEIVLDPDSVLDDYSDARFIHRFKWVSEETLTALYGKESFDELDAYFNHTNQPDAEYDSRERDREVGYGKQYDKYLLVHSVTKDIDNKAVSTYWCGETIFEQTDVDTKEVPFPYRVVKLHPSDWAEHYGIFREVLETQKAINQALIKLQQLVNTQKAFVEKDAVTDLAEFTNAYNRVTAVIPVVNLNGIKFENLSGEVSEQYKIISNALDRVQRTLGVNDSFLGMAYASDSGKKVQLQQNAATIALRYVTGRVEVFYSLLGWDIANLAKKYYKATDVIKITGPDNIDKLREINKPLELFEGQLDNQGNPIMDMKFQETLDDKGEPVIDKDGNYEIGPISDPDTVLEFSNIDIKITTVAYDDEESKNQVMLEQTVGGVTGQLLAQVNPAAFFELAKLGVEGLRTKNSTEVAALLSKVAEELRGNPAASEQASQYAQNTKQEN